MAAPCTVADLHEELERFGRETLPTALRKVLESRPFTQNIGRSLVTELNDCSNRQLPRPPPLQAIYAGDAKPSILTPISPDSKSPVLCLPKISEQPTMFSSSEMQGDMEFHCTNSYSVKSTAAASKVSDSKEGGVSTAHSDFVFFDRDMEVTLEGETLDTSSRITFDRSMDPMGIRHPRRYVVEKEKQVRFGNDLVEFGDTLPLNANFLGVDHEYISCKPPSVISRFANFLVKNGWLDIVCAIAIILNAVSLGAQSEWSATHYKEDAPTSLRVFEVSFCAVFAVELALRIIVHRLRFFTMVGWPWNWFDFSVVLLQVIDECTGLVMLTVSSDDGSHDREFGSTLSMMRILRVLRLVRIIRLVRILHLISELRTLVVSLFGCFQSLGWTLLLLFIMIYILSVYITQSVVATIKDDPHNAKYDPLKKYFGSLGTAMLSLFMSVSGGMSWELMLRPLMDEVSAFMGPLLVFFIGFTLLALFNVVNGVFVESALASASTDKELVLLNHIVELFKATDSDSDGKISMTEFFERLDQKDMQMYFKEVGLAPEEAVNLFKLIDLENQGRVTPDDFCNGCLRLCGNAKAYDLAILSHDWKNTVIRWNVQFQQILQAITIIQQDLRRFRCSNYTQNPSDDSDLSPFLRASDESLNGKARTIMKPRG